MNDLIKIGNSEITVKEYKGQRVVTFKDIDAVHERPDGTAKRNFNTNKKHLIVGEDFFFVKPSDVQAYEIRTSEINNSGTYLMTEQGYLMLVKSFTDDLAWKVQRQLVNKYFGVEDSHAPQGKELLALAVLEANKMIAEKDAQIAEMKPKAQFADSVSGSNTSILVRDLAKILRQNGVDIGGTRLFGWLREKGYLIKQRGADWNMPTQKSMNLGLFEIKQTVIHHADKPAETKRTPKVTGKGQQYFVNKFLRESGEDVI